jgi:hypothetical protein
MSMTHWLSSHRGLSFQPSSRRKTAAARRTVRPRLECLEDRVVLSTLTVVNHLDSGAGSLRADIAAAKSGDTIVFAPSLDGQTITLTSGELLIKKNLTIAGPGAGELTISGNTASRVFEVAQKENVALSGLTISNGLAVEGGGIENYGTLTLSAGTLSGNTANDEGGGINNYGTVTVSGSTLSNNHGSYGGGIATHGTATVSGGSILSGNSSAYAGGGIYNNGTLTVSGGSTLSGNSANTDGGGIANGGTLTVSGGSTLSGNTAGSFGGGIANQATLTVSGSTLSGNTAFRGGGIDNRSTLTVSDSNLTGNHASYGGGIYNYGTLTVSNSNLNGNVAAFEGGGIQNFYGTVTVSNSSNIIGNTAPVGFGADVYDQGVLNIDSSSTIGIRDND